MRVLTHHNAIHGLISDSQFQIRDSRFQIPEKGAFIRNLESVNI